MSIKTPKFSLSSQQEKTKEWAGSQVQTECSLRLPSYPLFPWVNVGQPAVPPTCAVMAVWWGLVVPRK